MPANLSDPSDLSSSDPSDLSDPSDDELIRGFEACTLPAGTLDHPAHVRLTWLYLRRMPLLEALAKISEGTRRFAAAAGAPGKYHETITWAFVLLVHERMSAAAGKAEESFEAFARRNPDLMRYRPPLLERWYRPETLASSRARATFVWPDRPAC